MKNSRLVLAALAFYMLLLVPSFSLGGVTWDEIFDFEGVNGAFWHGISLLKGEKPDISTITFDLEYFGNATRWPTYLFWRLMNTAPWESFQALSRSAIIMSSNYIGLNHLNAAFFGFLGILITGILGLMLGGRKLMFFGAALLLLLPTWLGHSWMNSKDIPFATSYLFYTLGSTFLFLPDRLSLQISRFQSSASQSLRILGLTLLLGSRIGSASFILVTEVIYALILKKAYLRTPLFSLAFGLIFALVLTPQAWGDPLGYPSEAIQFISNRQSSSSSWETLIYISWHLFDSLPFALVAGLIMAFASIKHSKITQRSVLPWLPIILQFMVTPILLILGSKSLYGELRHIEFIYPPLCIFSGIGYVRITALLKSYPAYRLFVIPLSFFFVTLILEICLLTPYQYTYRSDLSRLLLSGTPIHRDYWGFSVRETFIRSLKSPLISKADIANSSLRNRDWNSDLFDGLITLVSPVRTTQKLYKPNINLELQVGPTRDRCTSVVETTRTVLLPWPSPQLLSRFARCDQRSDLKT